MSQPRDAAIFAALSRVEKLLASHAEAARARNRDSVLPAHELLQCLKAPVGANTADDRGLTELGSLIRLASGPAADFDAVRWVTFHLSLPIPFQAADTVGTRNWIALRVADADILDAVHEPELAKGASHIQHIYAPSVVAQLLLTRRIAHARELRERAWIYRLTSVEHGCHESQHDRCSIPALDDISFLCFSPHACGHVLVTCCTDGLPDGTGSSTLGTLLGDDNSLAYARYEAFASLIRERHAAEFTRLMRHDRVLRCNFYARLPLFFACGPERYMTEVFVALNLPRNDIAEAARIVLRLDPVLRLCVSLINSHVGYNIAAYVRGESMARLLHAVLRHDMKNLGEAVSARAFTILHDWPRILERNPEKVKQSLLAIRADTRLSLMSTELDVLWQSEGAVRSDAILLPDLRKSLDGCWTIETITACDFAGQWDAEVLVPRVCSVVLANLLRNAMVPVENRQLRLEVQLAGTAIEFACLSEAMLSDAVRTEHFEGPLPHEVPSMRRGIWICRHIVERLLNGRVWLGPAMERFGTNIRFAFELGGVS